MKSIKFVGLDVHAETIAVAVAEQSGELRSLGVRHPPRSGWLGEWGRLKGGCPVGLTRRAEARLSE